MGLFKKDNEYFEKTKLKHEHDFKVHSILEVTIATGEIFYYNVYKCNKCNSFKGIANDKNHQGQFERVLNKREIKLPIISADSSRKELPVNFSKLKNIYFCKPDKKK